MPQITLARTTEEDGINMKGVTAGTKRKLFYQRFSPLPFTKPDDITRLDKALLSTKKTLSIAHILPWLCCNRPGQAAREEKVVFRGQGLSLLSVGHYIKTLV